jgi:7-cyano-7-deazaguanine synthase
MTSSEQRPAVVLLSGGLDSTTVLAYAARQGYALYALSFDYGQKNRFELERAEAIARAAGVCDHRKVHIDLRAFGGSSLVSDRPVERGRALEEIGRGIPSTYVPVRNTLFLSYALAWAEVLEAVDIFIGVNAVDTSGYPDCRPEFIQAFQSLANLATRLGTEGGRPIVVHAPLQRLNKAEIIRLGTELGVDYGMTNTCYDPLPGGVPCRTCDACILRARGFAEAGIVDPLLADKQVVDL